MGAIRPLRRTASLVAVALAGALALSACGESGGSSEEAPAAAPVGSPGGKAEPGRGEQAVPDAGGSDSGTQSVPADLRVEQRSIIYTGSIVLRVEDVDEAAAQAISIVTAAGGFVGGDNRTSNDARSEATMELRVPADTFTTVVDRLAELGEQERRDISTQDVTEEVIDLEARIATQRARVESGRRLLAQAKTLNDLILLESELAKREADLASLEAKKRRLADLTALSTITVVLLGPRAQVKKDDEPETGFLVGLRAGWRAFLASMRILLTVLGALIPWFIALGLPVFGLVWLLRRLGRRTQPTVAAMPSPQPVVPAGAAGRPQNAPGKPVTPAPPRPPRQPGPAAPAQAGPSSPTGPTKSPRPQPAVEPPTEPSGE